MTCSVYGVTRKVADTPLARAIDELVSRVGSDEKLAEKIGHGATRFGVMAWRKDGRVPEKAVYVSRLVELGIDAELLRNARDADVASRSALTERTKRLEEGAVDLGDSVQMLLELALILAEQVEALGGQVPAETLAALRQAIADRPT